MRRTFTFTFREFGRRFYPKRLTKSTFVEGDSNISLWYIKIRTEQFSGILSYEANRTSCIIHWFIRSSYWVHQDSRSSPEWPWATVASGALPWSLSACTLISYGVNVGVPDTTNLETLATTTEDQSASRSLRFHITRYCSMGPLACMPVSG